MALKPRKFRPEVALAGAAALAAPLGTLGHPTPAAAVTAQATCATIGSLGGPLLSAPPTVFGTVAFEAGDTLKVRVTGTASGTTTIKLDVAGAVVDQGPIPVTPAVVDTTLTYVFPKDELAELATFFTTPVTQNIDAALSCTSAPEEEAAVRQSGRQNLSNVATTGFDLIFGAGQGRPSPFGGARGGDGTAGLRPQARGGVAAGDASGGGLSVWGNASWSGIETDSSTETSGLQQVTAIVGAETGLSDRLTVGAGLSGGFSAFDSKSADQQISEGSVGLLPYASYRFDDIFSVDAALGYNYGFADSQRVGGTITGDFGSHRLFTGSNVNAFLDFDGPALFASAGLLYGMSWQNGFTESDGTQVNDLFLEFGRLRASLEPSWLFALDPDREWYLEPFARVEANYDFALTDADGSTEDRLFMRPGLGFNLYLGSDLSLTFDADTTAFLEKRRETSASATVRWQW